MKKIAIIENSMGLNGEKGYSRLPYLARFLAEDYGYDVELITSTFQHWEKKQRDIQKTYEKQSVEKYKTTLIYEPGYKKNVDMRRIASHWLFANNVIKHLSHNSYDLIYCTIPDNRLTAKVASYAHSRNIKIIVDVEDLWPEAMQMARPFPAALDRIIYYPFRRYAKCAYRNADAFIGTSDEYRDAPKKLYKIEKDISATVYVGCDIDVFDQGVAEYSGSILKESRDFWVTYSGTLGASYDLKTFITAISRAEKIHPNIKGVILGGGPDEEMLKEHAAALNANVEFVGYQPYKKMAAYLEKSDIVINSFVLDAPQSIVNKIGDYFASGKPVINTCSSDELKKKIAAAGVGRNVIAEDPEKLTALIVEMYEAPDALLKMGKGSRQLAESEFDRKVSYQVIENAIANLLNG